MGNLIRRRQRGAVLLVSLVFLLITSIIAVASMETSLLERKMSTSRELRELAFQTSEATIEDALNDLGYIGAAYSIGMQNSTDWPTRNHDFEHNDALEGVSEVRFRDRAPSNGYTVRKGASGVATFYFEVQATGSHEGSPVRSEHVQGIFVEGPNVE
jgi:Tfp pilus assembly protein PilX